MEKFDATKQPKITVDTTLFTNGTIEHTLNHSMAGEISKMLIDTTEQHTKYALIQLGWTPPNSETVPRATADKLAEALRYLMEFMDDIPESNCSCHINPPCSDCVNFSGIREETQEAQQALNEYNAAKVSGK